MIEHFNKYTYYSIIKKDKNSSFDNTILARNLLKSMLKSLKCEMPNIIVNKNGKPYFENSNILFNYSHSKKYIACVISNYEVGIDIEETNRIISDEIVKKYNLDYYNRIESWVKKEAFAKLKGIGLQMIFNNLKVHNINPNIIIKNKNFICCIYSDKPTKFKKLTIKKENI